MQHVTLKAATWMALENNGRSPVPTEILGPGALATVRREFDQHGLLGAGGPGNETLAGERDMSLSTAAVDQFAGKGSVRKYRSREAQLRVLEWIDANPDESSIEDMIGVANDDFTGPFDLDQLARAEAQLKELEMVKGTGSFGSKVLRRPELTTRGQMCLDNGNHPAELAEQGVQHVDQSQNNSFHGSVGGVQIGNYNTQNVKQVLGSTDVDDALKVVQKIREIVQEHAPEKSDSVDVLEDEFSSGEPNQTIVQGMLIALTAGTATALGTEAGEAISAYGASLLTLIGASA